MREGSGCPGPADPPWEEVRSILCGNAAAKKEAAAVATLLGVELPAGQPDAVDALALALCWDRQSGHSAA